MDVRINSIYKAYDNFMSEKTSVKGKRVSDTSKKEDNVKVSSSAKDFQAVMQALSKTKEANEDKILSIKERIKNGSYLDDISSEKVAERIIDNAFNFK